MIISIDESNFRVDAFKRRRWAFAPTRQSVSDILNSNVIEIESKLPPLSHRDSFLTHPATMNHDADYLNEIKKELSRGSRVDGSQ